MPIASVINFREENAYDVDIAQWDDEKHEIVIPQSSYIIVLTAMIIIFGTIWKFNEFRP